MHSRTISGTEKLYQILEKLDYHRYLYITPTPDQTQDPIKQEVRRRVQIAVWAYAYEICDDPLVSDEVFDSIAKQIDPNIKTGHPEYDKFFEEEFSPSTGMWIHKFPTNNLLVDYYNAWKKFFPEPQTDPS